MGLTIGLLNHLASHLKTKITWGRNAKPSAVSAKSLEIIDNAASNSNNDSLTITSTQRTSSDQARIMFENAEKNGVQTQYNTYKPAGDSVIDVYVSGKSQGLSKQEIISNMEMKISSLGPGTVSRHTANPEVLNVFDISVRSLQNPSGFLNNVQNNPFVSKVLSENGCFHLEIPQNK